MPGVTAVLPVEIVVSNNPTGATMNVALYHVHMVGPVAGHPEWCSVWLMGYGDPLIFALEPETFSARLNDYWNGIA